MLPTGGIAIQSDQQARQVIETARREQQPIPTMGLLAGDLCRTVGGPGRVERLHSSDAVTLPMDLVEVQLDGEIHYFVAHLVARDRWWWGRLVAIMNAQWLKKWDVAPKSHPNDGLLDLFDASSMSFDDRVKARSRLPTGTHVPHPSIAQKRSAEIDLAFHQPIKVWLDGELVGRFSRIVAVVEADAWQAVV